MSYLLLFLIATVGMTFIVLDSDFPPAKWLREKIEISGIEVLQDLWSCHQCMGWWCGLFMAILIYPLGWLTFPLACAGSITSMVSRMLLDYLGFLKANAMAKSALLDVEVRQAYSSDQEEVDA